MKTKKDWKNALKNNGQENDGWGMVLRMLNRIEHIETLSGIKDIGFFGKHLPKINFLLLFLTIVFLIIKHG